MESLESQLATQKSLRESEGINMRRQINEWKDKYEWDTKDLKEQLLQLAGLTDIERAVNAQILAINVEKSDVLKKKLR